ncbi:hypothetical protein THAOC_13929 [Thalassiosira oceanica]|uniref:Uncharacterized protein n=1 Tax=Thalassiosira oceanica TaxID=159749 RepID=K0SGJ1_THAOC|nr:hypothetical protein THAOC_13929 [Thalassiosira oceanica]|eukprot:EJK65238.1 hypothetical protein THAOC_13929 [Thalassiosira oceanica]
MNATMGVKEARHLFNAFRDMESLKELYLSDLSGSRSLNDNVMAGCIPSLAACKDIRELKLEGYSMSTNSCTALSAVLPRMTLLLELSLGGNSIDDRCVEVLVRGLVESSHLNMLDLGGNSIGDDGLDVLIQGLPASVGHLDVSENEITLSRQLPLLRFKILNLAANSLSPGGPQVVAASLVNSECHLEEIYLFDTYIGDEGATILAGSLLGNQRLTKMVLAGDRDDERGWNKITETGWNAFLPILCNTANINATHGSNHTLKHLEEDHCELIPNKVNKMLWLNCNQDTSSIAAQKILQTHRHLDMKPLFDRKLDLLPYVVAWLERFAESRLNLKLSSIYEFVRAIPTKAVEGVEGKKKGKKRSRDLLSHE